ncbi:hypothetical protein ACFC1T_09040 [Kitasatospora sp. NPDC056076]|uniref:hypothetical protein n=1 Tax=Kitasatospora sp. NPDC056076 TaxID=3345703 RepID=UPI0035D7A41B
MRYEQKAAPKSAGLTLDQVERLAKAARDNGARGTEVLVCRSTITGRLRSLAVEVDNDPFPEHT